jgi:hypothetical protein
VAYVAKATVGLALFIGGVVLFNVELQQLLDIGTCASGNTPYEISQPCPEGTGTKILLLVLSIFGGMTGAGIFAFRGDPPWGRRKPTGSLFGLGTLAWGLFFAGTGAALLIGQPYGEVVDPGTGDTVARPDSQLGSTITGITFLVMGVPALLIGGWNQIKALTGGRDESPAMAGIPKLGGLLSELSRSSSSGGQTSRSRGEEIGKSARRRRSSGTEVGFATSPVAA